jgi:hydroxymethylglutaryl-CoA lyase
MRGMEKALESGVKEIAVFAAASEAFSKKNINCTIEESLQRFEAVMKTARDNDVKVRGYVSCVATCPYSKENSDPAVVNEVAQAMLDLGCYEISLGDTTGHAQIGKYSTPL